MTGFRGADATGSPARGHAGDSRRAIVATNTRHEHSPVGRGAEHQQPIQRRSQGNGSLVANPTTAAQYFHVLRRQLHREIRKPLILMTPKSLLRHKRAVSRLDELGADATFHHILYDDAQMLPDEKIKLTSDDKIRRVVLMAPDATTHGVDMQQRSLKLRVSAIPVDQSLWYQLSELGKPVVYACGLSPMVAAPGDPGNGVALSDLSRPVPIDIARV